MDRLCVPRAPGHRRSSLGDSPAGRSPGATTGSASRAGGRVRGPPPRGEPVLAPSLHRGRPDRRTRRPACEDGDAARRRRRRTSRRDPVMAKKAQPVDQKRRAGASPSPKADRRTAGDARARGRAGRRETLVEKRAAQLAEAKARRAELTAQLSTRRARWRRRRPMAFCLRERVRSRSSTPGRSSCQRPARARWDAARVRVEDRPLGGA
jgi:hypothetical protein